MSDQKGATARRGTNLPAMADFNQSVILDAVRRSATGLSRVELVGATGLSPQTISNITRRLIDSGFIEEAGKTGTGPGKPRTMLRLDPSGRYALGVHLDPTVVTCVMLDLTGSVVRRSSFPTPSVMDPTLIIGQIVAALVRLIDDSGVPRNRIGGVGIAAPGPIDNVLGTVVDPPHLVGWHRVPLRDALQAGVGLPSILDKDVTASAIAEMWAGGESGLGSFAFFYLGTGIGVGLVMHDEVVRGSSGNAGEVGHIVTDPEGPLCFCGLRGCIEVTCTPQALVQEAERLGVFDAIPVASGTRTVDSRFTELCAAAEAGNATAIEIVERSAVRMSKAVAVIANLLDVDRVVFGGPFWARLSGHYLRRIPELLGELRATRSIHQISVTGSTVGEDVGAIGAACLVLDRALAPNPRALLLA
ncbi:transcriptional regulator [Cryobacterium sp. MLB-32]|uniref:ROK family transcriptional regulator n=1 Tax=Cryobacterium sp. MLB-32 TaxID=1529318 RepID=UPI0004E77F2C|nr:ROK family transcriptional regulator [Cryobacterium sp. MLB-32]KFF58686.1 transcriptional regulator [Cryobacterium sp. MLB-32]